MKYTTVPNKMLMGSAGKGLSKILSSIRVRVRPARTDIEHVSGTIRGVYCADLPVSIL